jgi:hypothetical protein
VADPEAGSEEGGSGSVNYSEENKKRAADFGPGAFFYFAATSCQRSTPVKKKTNKLVSQLQQVRCTKKLAKRSFDACCGVRHTYLLRIR